MTESGRTIFPMWLSAPPPPPHHCVFEMLKIDPSKTSCDHWLLVRPPNLMCTCCTSPRSTHQMMCLPPNWAAFSCCLRCRVVQSSTGEILRCCCLDRVGRASRLREQMWCSWECSIRCEIGQDLLALSDRQRAAVVQCQWWARTGRARLEEGRQAKDLSSSTVCHV